MFDMVAGIRGVVYCVLCVVLQYDGCSGNGGISSAGLYRNRDM